MKRLVSRRSVTAMVALVACAGFALAINAGEPTKHVRVIYTNDTLGYLEPCGCGGVTQGGLPLRATVISQLVKENPNHLIVESGNLSSTADRLKLIASVLADMQYDAVGVGETDLRVCGEAFYKDVAESKLAVLDASPTAKEPAIPYLVKNVDGVRVGVISFGAVAAGANQNDYQRRKALYAAYRTVREESDVLVVLDQANMVSKEWIERNEKRIGAPDIVIGGVASSHQPQEQTVGVTHMMPTSVQGKHVGVVDIEVTPDGHMWYNTQRILVDKKFAPDESVTKRVKSFVAKIQPVPVQNASAQSPMPVSGDRSKIYYSSQLCKTCHVKQYDDWEKTKHAHAVQTLTAENRALPECMKCHSESFRLQGKALLVGNIVGGVECSSCHMNALPHGMERRNVAAKSKVDPKICVDCHDNKWSPNFDQPAYLARVSHQGGATASGLDVASPTPPPAIR